LTTYAEVAGALVRAGYLTDADLEAAAAVLADALVVADAEDMIDTALDDEAYQESMVIEAKKWSDENAAAGDFKGADIDDEVIAIAEDQQLEDEAIVIEAEATIAATYTDAAAALLTAELIDEANLDAVAAAIDDAWVVEVD
jgi:hypothetical protein